MHKPLILTLATTLALTTGCPGVDEPASDDPQTVFPDTVTVSDVAQNPEGIEYDTASEAFLLSNLNAGPILKIQLDGTHTPFTWGEPYPLSTAGLQIDAAGGRLLAAGFNGNDILDDDPATRGISVLRIYDLATGEFEQDVELSALVPDAWSYFANDIAVDDSGNAYVSDWFAGVVYKVDAQGTPSVLWTNTSVVPGGPNGLDYHPDGYLLVSVINDGSYSEHALVKVPLDDPDAAADVSITGAEFSGFDGMVITTSGRVVGVTNDGVSAGGNVLLELSSDDGWASAAVTRSAAMAASTTVAVTPQDLYYVIHQDFSDAALTEWTIERIALP